MKRLVFLAALLAGAGCDGANAPVVKPTPTPGPVVQQLVDAHNARRVAGGLAALRQNAALQRVAQGHADAMARSGRMSHDRAGDGGFVGRIARSGYRYSNCGENIAWNQPDVNSVMGDWMGSSGHRRNVLGKFTEMGAAVSYGKNHDPYWCCDFGTPVQP